MLELFDEDFKMAILKMLQGAIINRLDTKEKIESLSREIKAMETNWNFKTEKYSNPKPPNQAKQSKKLTGWAQQ